MQKSFAQTIEDMKGLINEWSAPFTDSQQGPCKLLLAVSGGMDSMCMADLSLSCLSKDGVAIAHCNFNLRGDESDGDEALVRRWALDHDVRLHVNSFDTEGYAAEKGISIEMAARELRYRWFADLCRSYGYVAVAVAHNANDNAETLMLNLLRGSGLSGLSGMSTVSSVPYSDSAKVKLLRPLLKFTRKQIEGYVFMNKVPYRNDSTNALSDYKRNRIRNEIFPVFEKLNPSAVRTINREMGYFAEAEDIVADYCSRVVPSLKRHGLDGCIHVDINSLMQHKHWRYLLYHILEPYGFNSTTLESLNDLLSSERTVSGKRFHSAEYVLVTGRDEIVVSSAPLVRNTEIMTIRGAGTYHFNGRSFKVEEYSWSSDMQLRQPEGVIVMDAERLHFPFILRTWRDGDWLVPLGMKGKKKVSDLFTDLKYDAFMKEDAVIIVDVCDSELAQQQRIAGVAGVRIDDRFKVTSSTRKVVRITSDPTGC